MGRIEAANDSRAETLHRVGTPCASPPLTPNVDLGTESAVRLTEAATYLIESAKVPGLAEPMPSMTLIVSTHVGDLSPAVIVSIRLR